MQPITEGEFVGNLAVSCTRSCAHRDPRVTARFSPARRGGAGAAGKLRGQPRGECTSGRCLVHGEFWGPCARAGQSKSLVGCMALNSLPLKRWPITPGERLVGEALLR